MVKEIGDEEEGGRRQEKGQGYLTQRDKGLSLDGEETDMPHRQMVVYKSKGGNPVLG